MLRLIRLVAGAIALFTTLSAAHALELVIWHDKGDDGVKMFKEIGDLFQKQNPTVTIRSLSFPTDQWFSRSIAAINTATGPDLIFNDNFRNAIVQQSTNKLHDFANDLKSLPEATRKHVTPGDVEASLYKGKMVMLPTQRTLSAWGARKSWLEKVGEKMPVTWEDALRIARKFQDNDPDGNGKNDTFGLALQAGNASVLHQMLEWMMFGAGLRHVAVDGNGAVVLDQPKNARVLIEHLKLFTEHKLVSPETRNHIFTDMYQIIEGGRAGFFRVGDFNVRKWDREGLKGDFVIGPLPTFFADAPPSVVVHGMRSVSVPVNGRNVDMAVKFARFMLESKEAQEVSLLNMGSAVRKDLSTAGLSPSQVFFATTALPAAPNDFPDSVYPWYPQFKEALYKELSGAIANPPRDWNVWIGEVSARLRTVVEDLKKKG